MRNLPTDPEELCDDAVQEAWIRLIKWPRVKEWTKEDLFNVAAYNLHLCINIARSDAYGRKEYLYASDALLADTEDADARVFGAMNRSDTRTPERHYSAKQTAPQVSSAPRDIRGALKSAINKTNMRSENKAMASMMIDCCLDNRQALKVIKSSNNIIFKNAVLAEHLKCSEERVRQLRQKIIEHAPDVWAWLESQGYGYALAQIPQSPRNSHRRKRIAKSRRGGPK